MTKEFTFQKNQFSVSMENYHPCSHGKLSIKARAKEKNEMNKSKSVKYIVFENVVRSFSNGNPPRGNWTATADERGDPSCNISN